MVLPMRLHLLLPLPLPISLRDLLNLLLIFISRTNFVACAALYGSHIHKGALRELKILTVSLFNNRAATKDVETAGEC